MSARRASFKVRRRLQPVWAAMRFFENRSFTFWIRLIGAPLMGIAFNRALDYTSPPDVAEFYHTKVPVWLRAFDMLTCILSAWVIAEGAIWLTRFLDRYQPWEKAPVRRLFWQVALTGLFSLVAVLLLSGLYDLGTKAMGVYYEFPHYDPAHEKKQHVLLGSWLTLLLLAVYLGGLFFHRWKASLTEAARLRQAATQAQLDALKAQLDPHFLFNNFSTLTALIEEDPKLAVDYLGRLSQVYRYVLLHRDRDRTTLGQELDFIRAYLFLSQIRFDEEALRVEISVPEEQRAAGIAPLTLQLLVENALKHNVISRTTPLHLRIGMGAGGWLEVRNLCQPLARPEPSSGTGLKNIIARYALLGAPGPEVVAGETEFLVRVPLLPVAAPRTERLRG